MPPSHHDRIVAEGLTFDDLLLLPGFADFAREEADLSTELHPTIRLKLPILSSPMDTVTEEKMAVAMAESGGLGVIHRNMQVEKQAATVRAVKEKKPHGTDASVDAEGRLSVAAAVGAGADIQERVQALVTAGVDLITVDSGHGHAQYILDAVRQVKKLAKHVPVMAGNIATEEGARALMEAGADILRVGMGPGSICTTRVVTGMGVPQMTALFAAAKACRGTKTTFVADGGIRMTGDIAKALATGASAVMLGSMLAGFEQSPGETVDIKGEHYKRYRGMGSIGAMQKGGAERYGQSAKTERSKLIAEGVEGLVRYKGDVGEFLYQVAGSLRSSFYYLGTKTVNDFHKHARFVRITPASMHESHPHTITVTDAGGNYAVS